ncbi:hypothetical protein F5Y14DRAFT_454246 [Nemania sp. NC0429]|nr:hypothetical protein F5Y14DRAFT_454246 [Nemania sp. NC0429]
MPSTSPQDNKSPQPHQSTQNGGERNANASSDSECESPTVLTGEFRMSFRERMRRLRNNGKSGSYAPLQLGIPKAVTHLTEAPQTPPIRSPSSECPDAPRKKKIDKFRQLGQTYETEEDMMLDQKANKKAKQPPTALDTIPRSGYADPNRRALSEKSPNDFADINTKFHSYAKIPDVVDDDAQQGGQEPRSFV